MHTEEYNQTRTMHKRYIKTRRLGSEKRSYETEEVNIEPPISKYFHLKMHTLPR